MGNSTPEPPAKSSVEEEEIASISSSAVSFGTSRRNSKVSAVTVTESDSEGTDQIYGGSRSRQSRLSVTVDIKLSKGIQQVNRGNYEEAVGIFNSILTETPKSCGALLGRGTAYAFMRKLKKAITDFSKAIEVDPKTAEAWKRRGQARAAIGETTEALEDLSKAIKLEPTPDLLHERGVVNFKLKNFYAAIEDLKGCLAQDAENMHAHNYLGLALTASGSYAAGIKAQRKAVELDDNFKEGWVHLAQSYKELADSEKAIECLKKATTIDDKYGNAYRLWGTLLYSLGEHRNASKMLTTAAELEVDTLECIYLRGSCSQALGEFSDAVSFVLMPKVPGKCVWT
jgi:tetratricopeptide (TPR) repeat protein